MVGGIDISKRKPRRLGNTPARAYVNKLSFLTLGTCSLIGVGLYFLCEDGITKFWQKDWVVEEVKRSEDFRYLMRSQLFPHRGPEGIKKQLDYKEDSDAAF